MHRLAFAFTVFAGACLLFSVQPMAAKALLPRFGGSPATWATCLLFFQVMLFLGYAYAHALSRLASLRTQVLAQLGWLAFALARLPLELGAGSMVDSTADPTWPILRELALEIGPAYLLLSATAPLVQHWLALGRPAQQLAAQRSVYRLYAYSNAGSLAGLFAYPLVVAPQLDLSAQAQLWSVGYGMFGVGLLACGFAATTHELRAEPCPAPAPGVREPAARVVTWIALACLPSAMLLAVTNHLSVDVAATPLLWVLPLALYLGSMILCFAGERFQGAGWFLPLWTLSTLAMALSLMQHGSADFVQQLVVFGGALFALCMVCHGRLARDRPDASGLTAYYLAIAFGGALGGLLVALVAPKVAPDYLELQLIATAAYPLLLSLRADPREALRGAQRRWLWLGLGLAVPALLSTVALGMRDHSSTGQVLERRRSFHGVLRVTRLSDVTLLTHGRIRHGMQWNDPARSAEPTMYFGPESGIGRVLRRHALERRRRIGIVGLGVGTLAVYGRESDSLRFYELSPDVVALAQSRFTFLAQSAARLEISVGDGRLTLAHEPRQDFDVLVLDAFSSDAVPTHLLTLEAFSVYLRQLAPDGILALNVSNRHLDVERVVAASASAHGLTLSLVETPKDPERGFTRVRWAVLARSPSLVDAALGDAPRADLAGLPVRWTDRHGDVFSILR